MSGIENPPFILNMILTFASKAYGAGVGLRRKGYESGFLKSRKLPCYVISIGNLTTGGTGKTPMAIYVARLAEKSGCRVAVISRGYKGRAESEGGIVSDGKTILMSPETAGDEPFLMASALNGIPVLVGSNRYESGMTAINRFKSEVLVLDDGFQHLALYRDLNILLLDSAKPFGNGHLLPRGILREPLTSISHSDALIMTRSDRKGPGLIETFYKDRPFFRAFHVPYVSNLFSFKESRSFKNETPVNHDQFIREKSFFAFSGIANNEDFFNTLRKMGANLCGMKGFADHHVYKAQDIHEILNASASAGASCLVTTEKDYVKLHGRFELPDCLVIGVGISLENGMEFDRFIQNRLSLKND